MSGIITNEVTKAIMNRRSIRKYGPEQISKEQFDTLVACGFNAPSGGNRQMWFLSVIQSPELFRELTDKQRAYVLAAPGLPASARERVSAADFSAVMGAPTAFFFSHPKGSWNVDACLMAENVVLAAQSLGLGSCYLGGILDVLKNDKDLTARLGVPEDHELAFGLTVGYPAESPRGKAARFFKNGGHKIAYSKAPFGFPEGTFESSVVLSALCGL